MDNLALSGGILDGAPEKEELFAGRTESLFMQRNDIGIGSTSLKPRRKMFGDDVAKGIRRELR
jgi:hypothetical protein